MPSHKSRLRILSFFILAFALLLGAKLYMVQIVSGDVYVNQADNQHVVGSKYYDRGSIFFTSKEGTSVPAASVRNGYVIYINPNILNTKSEGELGEIYTAVNAILPTERDDFFSKAKKQNDPYEEIARRVDAEKADAIHALKIPGVATAKDRWRFYPGESAAAHMIGLIGYQGDTLAGRYGLERFYEPILERTGEDVFVNFFAEIFSNIRKAVSAEESLEGDIVTTIEPSVQAYLESELADITSKYSSEFTGGIVINPQTGDIYAMALDPTFDPNSPQSASDSSVFRNRLVEDRYEMGSIIKALTMAIGIDAGAITSKSTYNDPGCMTLNTRTFCNYDGRSHGTSVTMQTALSNSLNTGSAYVALRVGAKNFSEKMLAFGLEDMTGIDLPNEGKSLVSNLKTGRDLEMAQASFGQGIALTPVGTVRALSALANGGTLITPRVVKEVRYKLGPSKKIMQVPEEERDRAISKEASIEISRMLTENVDRSLRNGTLKLENYSIAAKTGTAQIARESGRGYYDDRYLHSFFGYFPAYEPEYLVFLYTYYPKGVQYASETLTDGFMNLTKFLINYYNVPPDRTNAPRAGGITPIP